MAETYNPGPSASFTGPASQPSKWKGTDCRSLLSELRTNVNTLIDKAMKRKRVESKRVQAEAEKRKSGGLLDKIISGPLSAAKDRYKAVMNTQDEAQSSRSFADRYVSYLDLGASYAGLTSDIVSGVVNTVVDELAVVNQVSEAAGLGSVVPSGQQGSCNQNLLIGTVDSLVRVAEGAVAAQVKQVFTAQATLGLALQAVPDIYSAIMSMPAGTLSILLTNKKKITERIESVVRQVVTLANEIRAADYPTDHRALINWALGELGEAGDYLGQVEQTLEAGGKFMNDIWDKAHEKVSDTGDTMLRAESRFPTDTGFVKMLQLLAHQKDLETLISVLDQRQALYKQFVGLIGDFTTSFSTAADFKNLAGPLVQQIRCVLQVIIDDMTKSLDRNSLIQYYLKEKQWGIELVQLAVLMDGTKFMGSTLAAPKTEMTKLTDSLSAQVSENSASFMEAENYQTLRTLLGSFVREIKRKIASNSDPQILAGIGDAIIAENARLNTVEDGLAKLLANFNNGFAKEGLVAAQAVSAISEVFSQQGLESYVGALMKGDWKEIFGLNALKASAEAKTRKLIGDLLQCCQDNAGDGDAAQRLRNMSTTVQTLQQAKELYDRYAGGFAERYSAYINRTALPGLKATKTDVSKLAQATCMNAKAAPGAATLPDAGGLTLL